MGALGTGHTARLLLGRVLVAAHYGHRVTAGNTNSACVANGVSQCKQIWIGAVRKDRITGATTLDPSAPPMWLPGQDTQTDNISPYWTQPAGIAKH